MAQETSTIREPTDTRDELARQARAQGVSVAALLTEIAEQRRRCAVFAAEREAAAKDRTNSACADELVDWEDTLGDGIG